MTEIIFLVVQAPDGAFTARALGESIFTQAETFEELREKIRDAVRCHFHTRQRPAVIRLHCPASGGDANTLRQDTDPFAALMDIMEVVEALCPRWPNRTITTGQYFLL